MLYMIVEHFRGGDSLPVYRRFRDQGRLAPDGLLLEQWMANRRDLVEFEVVPVKTSVETAADLAPRL